MKQTRDSLCKRKSGVARCQAQQQCHFWRINLMFEIEVVLVAVNHIYVFHEVENGCKNQMIH